MTCSITEKPVYKDYDYNSGERSLYIIQWQWPLYTDSDYFTLTVMTIQRQWWLYTDIDHWRLSFIQSSDRWWPDTIQLDWGLDHRPRQSRG